MLGPALGNLKAYCWVYVSTSVDLDDVGIDVEDFPVGLELGLRLGLVEGLVLGFVLGFMEGVIVGMSWVHR